MSAGFTPGPWTATRSIPAEGYDCWWITACPDGANSEKDLATVAGGYPHNLHEANARLIAAAPRLYAALATFEKQWNACGGNSEFGRFFQYVRDEAVAALSEANANHWLNTSRAALAKARGEAA